MGVGLLEILVIFLVAFLVLGPGRSISTARSAGKFLSNLRRTFNEVAEAASLEQQESERRREPPDSKPTHSQDTKTDTKAGDE